MNINKLNSAMTECVTTDLTLRKEKPEQFKKVLYHRLVVCVVVVGGGSSSFYCIAICMLWDSVAQNMKQLMFRMLKM